MARTVNWRGPADDPALALVVQVLAGGGVVACPTETFYALAVDAFQAEALERLVLLKDRPPAKGLLVLVAEPGMVGQAARVVSPLARRLMDCFWPGPLTLILPARPELPRLLTGGTGTVGVRQSGHPLARRLVALYGRPLTGTSANRSGRPPLTSADGVVEEIGDLVDIVLRDGPCPGGLPSTILDVTCDPPRLVRAGALGVAALEEQSGIILA